MESLFTAFTIITFLIPAVYFFWDSICFLYRIGVQRGYFIVNNCRIIVNGNGRIFFFIFKYYLLCSWVILRMIFIDEKIFTIRKNPVIMPAPNSSIIVLIHKILPEYLAAARRLLFINFRKI